MQDSPEAIARDVAKVGRIAAVPSLLKLVTQTTGMGFAAVARVTDHTWTACAVQDDIGFGLLPGGQLELNTTLCMESRQQREPIVIDHVSANPLYQAHHTPRIYNIESYISVPIVLRDGEYFGNLCAIDPRPARVADEKTLTLFTLLAELIATQLMYERQHEAASAALLDERAAGELREQFIAVLGHDLRSPLQAVVHCGHVLERSEDPKQVHRLARIITASTRRMSGLIDDVLDFARGRLGGGFHVELADVPDLGAALHETVTEQRVNHPGRALVEEIDVAGPVRCDRARVEQLATNLLANAMTHGAADKPVSFSAKRTGDSLVITVGNAGEPIPAEHLPMVFKPFWRSATSNNRTGLGLGLFICAEIVRAHGGRLEVASSPAQGTVFTATLPLHAAP